MSFGALGDLALHLVSVARLLRGPIRRVVADQQTLIATRPLAAGGDAAEKRSGPAQIDFAQPERPVENEDTAHALLQFMSPTIPDALKIERILHAIVRSAATGAWVETGDA
jgi:predicted dehydrogenase